MRILMTADTVGGVWSYTLELSAALAARDVEVSLATLGPPPDDAQRQEAMRAGVELHDSSYRLEWMPEPWEDVERSGTWLLELADSEQVDLVHLCSYSHGALPWEVPSLLVGHSCVVSWWNAVHGEDPPPGWDRYRTAVSAGLAAADEVVAPSAAMLRSLARHHGLRGGRVIENGIPSPTEQMPHKEQFALAAGRLWDPAKNLAALERVAPGLPWPVLAAGAVDGRAPTGVEALGRVSRRELAELRSRAAIFVAPARYEPFGLAILEAAAAGCALVLGAIESLREVWGDAALYVDPDEPAALRAALERLIESDRERVELARRARRRARRYTAERMAQRYAELYATMRERAEVVA